MTPNFDQIRQFAQELPVEQRILLANSLWESAAWGDEEAAETEVAAAWDAELGRRIAEIKSGTAKSCTLEELAVDLQSLAQ